MQFVGRVARHVWPPSSHLSCVQTCTCLSAHRIFPQALKTLVILHLTAVALTQVGFPLWLDDLLKHFCCCLENKCLNSFLLCNQRVPEEMIVSLVSQTAIFVNLFQCLIQELFTHVSLRSYVISSGVRSYSTDVERGLLTHRTVVAMLAHDNK